VFFVPDVAAVESSMLLSVCTPAIRNWDNVLWLFFASMRRELSRELSDAIIAFENRRGLIIKMAIQMRLSFRVKKQIVIKMVERLVSIPVAIILIIKRSISCDVLKTPDRRVCRS